MSAELSELGRSAAVSALFEGTPYKNEAILPVLPEGYAAAVHRLFLEGADFDLTYTPLRHLGYKLVLMTVGELYARLLRPRSVSAVLALPQRIRLEPLREFWSGAAAALQEHGVSSVSLELTPSPRDFAVSLSAFGERAVQALEGQPAAQSCDLLALTGPVGAAYMGLHVLEREKVAFRASPDGRQPDLSGYRSVLAEYLSPELPAGLPDRMLEAGIVPCAGEFVHRGLAYSVLELARRTGLGAKVYVDRIPIASQTFDVCAELDIDPVTAAMNGGDDCRLLWVVPIALHEKLRHEFPDMDIVGHLARPEAGAVLVTPEGAEIGIKSPNY